MYSHWPCETKKRKTILCIQIRCTVRATQARSRNFCAIFTLRRNHNPPQKPLGASERRQSQSQLVEGTLYWVSSQPLPLPWRTGARRLRSREDGPCLSLPSPPRYRNLFGGKVTPKSDQKVNWRLRA